MLLCHEGLDLRLSQNEYFLPLVDHVRVFYPGNRKAVSTLLQWELVKELRRCVCSGDNTAMCVVWTLGLCRAAYFDFSQFKLDLRDT